MIEVPIAEEDVHTALDILGRIPEDESAARIREALEAAPAREIAQGGKVRLISFLLEDVKCLISALEDFRRHGGPTAGQRTSLNRVIAKLQSVTRS